MRKIDREELKERLRFILRLISYSFFAFALILLIVYILPPVAFNLFWGDAIINETIQTVEENASSADSKAIELMRWEDENFMSIYHLVDSDKFLQNYKIFKVGEEHGMIGEYAIFYKSAPISWVLYSGLANCGEHANVFAYLMDEMGVPARVVRAPGEDHQWAKYKSHGYWVTVDPSANEILRKPEKKEMARKKNFSYVYSANVDGSNSKDVSEEYIERGMLKLKVIKDGASVKNEIVVVKNPALMEKKPEKYNKPQKVMQRKTDENGTVSFKLGQNEYIIELTQNCCYLFKKLYSKDVTVTAN